MPPVLGWTAIQNGITFEPLVLFLIILYGPHHIFGLLLYIEKTIMRKLVFPCYLLLMVVILRNYIYFSMLTIVYSIFITFFTGMNSYLYLISAIFLGLIFIYKAYDLLKYYNDVKSVLCLNIQFIIYQFCFWHY